VNLIGVPWLYGCIGFLYDILVVPFESFVIACLVEICLGHLWVITFEFVSLVISSEGKKNRN